MRIHLSTSAAKQTTGAKALVKTMKTEKSTIGKKAVTTPALKVKQYRLSWRRLAKKVLASKKPETREKWSKKLAYVVTFMTKALNKSAGMQDDERTYHAKVITLYSKQSRALSAKVPKESDVKLAEIVIKKPASMLGAKKKAAVKSDKLGKAVLDKVKPVTAEEKKALYKDQAQSARISSKNANEHDSADHHRLAAVKHRTAAKYAADDATARKHIDKSEEHGDRARRLAGENAAKPIKPKSVSIRINKGGASKKTGGSIADIKRDEYIKHADAASDSSEKARTKNTAELHEAAAAMHDTAAKYSVTPVQKDRHQRRADVHRSAAKELSGKS